MIQCTLLTTEPELAVVNAQRVTRGRPLVAFCNSWSMRLWEEMIAENHSTLRAVRLRVYLDSCRSDVARQLVRHTKGFIQPYMQSSRPDWTGNERPPEPYPVGLILDFDPEGWLFLAEQRLCERAMKETKETVENIVYAMHDSEIPVFQALAELSMPPCVKTGMCTQRKGCGRFPYWRVE